jgi:serine/threonine protein kinase
MNPIVIGEGTYGCVHKPSLKCVENGMDYDNKISKLIHSRDAIKELKEYLVIQDADPSEEFFLGIPNRCNPAQLKRNIDAAKKCRIANNAIDKTNNKIKDDYNLLIMNDGGLNLYDFAIKMSNAPATEKNKNIMEDFWIECHRLFRGLNAFISHDIIHNDLKGQNIVYNMNTNRVAFIDFGLMKPLSKKSHNISVLKRDIIIHWSYPVETLLYNENNYYSKSYRKQWLDGLRKYGIKHIYDEAFLTSILPSSKMAPHVKKDDIARMLYSTIEFTLQDDTYPYNLFLKHSLETFDLYGTCMGLLFVLNRTFHLLKDSAIDFEKLYELLFNCVRPDIFRYTAYEALVKYEVEILQDILTKKKKKHFVNNLLIHDTSNDKVKTDIPKISDKKLEEIIELKDKKMYEKIKNKECPDGKERNPNTGRCVNKCKPGQIRDENYRCKTVKKKSEPPKKCPEGKERNPNTGRCVNKCKPGQIRDENYRCKTVKKKSEPPKKCPEGKERNPNTGRCVNKCKPGQIRDENYRCKTMKKK